MYVKLFIGNYLHELSNVSQVLSPEVVRLARWLDLCEYHG